METDQISLLSKIKFWCLLILSISSSITALFIFIYFYRQRKKISIHQHLTLILVTMSFIQMTTDFPFGMVYYYHGTVAFQSNTFCLWRNWWCYSISGAPIFAMAWGSIERHLLVFNRSLMNIRRNQILYHILPMLIVTIYPFIFYFAAIILNRCENQWDYKEYLCDLPCYLIVESTLNYFDSVVNIATPIITITVANIVLIVRVLRQKRSRQEVWRRQRKLIRQLLVVATLYIIFWYPLLINGFIYPYISSPLSDDLQKYYFYFLPTILAMLIPFVSVPMLPGFKNLVLNRQRSIVATEMNQIQRISYAQT